MGHHATGFENTLILKTCPVPSFLYICKAFCQQGSFFFTVIVPTRGFLACCLHYKHLVEKKILMVKHSHLFGGGFGFILLTEKNSRTSVWHSNLEGPRYRFQTVSECPSSYTEEPRCAADTPVHPARGHKEWGEAEAADFSEGNGVEVTWPQRIRNRAVIPLGFLRNLRLCNSTNTYLLHPMDINCLEGRTLRGGIYFMVPIRYRKYGGPKDIEKISNS